MKIGIFLLVVLFAAFARAEPLKVVSFPGGSNLPIWVALDQGMFDHEGLEVDLVPTAGSRAQIQELLAGGSQVVLTASDNVLATSSDAGPASPIAVIMSIDPGFQNVIGAREVVDFSELKGRVVAVDAPDSGYAFALYAILQKHGLRRDVDYRLSAVGGGFHRWEALQADTAAAALMATPLEFVAQAKGFHVLAQMDRELGAYAGNVAAVRRDWAAAHAGATEGFVRAVKTALAFLQAPANRAKAKELLVRKMADVTPAMADKSLDRMLDPESGFSRSGDIDRNGLAVVIALRREFSQGGPPLGEIDRYLLP
jgi:ABC-type nitrate/sulfonate/bicarbonate transport system substrate-binding protein